MERCATYSRAGLLRVNKVHVTFYEQPTLIVIQLTLSKKETAGRGGRCPSRRGLKKLNETRQEPTPYICLREGTLCETVDCTGKFLPICGLSMHRANYHSDSLRGRRLKGKGKGVLFRNKTKEGLFTAQKKFIFTDVYTCTLINFTTLIRAPENSHATFLTMRFIPNNSYQLTFYRLLFQTINNRDPTL